MPGKLFIISGPGGSGKTTLACMIAKALHNFQQSISTTTRAPRPGEVDGTDYNFVTKADFKKKIEAGAFIEHAEVFGNWYGTEKNLVFSALNAGKHVILVIDVQGALEVKKQLDAVSIFISPPSLDVLKKRLELRKAGEEEMTRRLKAAGAEMKMAGNYDYQLVNDDLGAAFEQLKEIFIREGESCT